MRETFNREHVLSLCEDGDCGLCAPSMKAQVAIDELRRYFLGDDWFINYSCSEEQANTEIVVAIQQNYKGNKMKGNKMKGKAETVPIS